MSVMNELIVDTLSPGYKGIKVVVAMIDLKPRSHVQPEAWRKMLAMTIGDVV